MLMRNKNMFIPNIIEFAKLPDNNINAAFFQFVMTLSIVAYRFDKFMKLFYISNYELSRKRFL